MKKLITLFIVIGICALYSLPLYIKEGITPYNKSMTALAMLYGGLGFGVMLLMYQVDQRTSSSLGWHVWDNAISLQFITSTVFWPLSIILFLYKRNKFQENHMKIGNDFSPPPEILLSAIPNIPTVPPMPTTHPTSPVPLTTVDYSEGQINIEVDMHSSVSTTSYFDMMGYRYENDDDNAEEPIKEEPINDRFEILDLRKDTK